jgi:hypothetical protein
MVATQEVSSSRAEAVAKKASIIRSRHSILSSPAGKWVMAGMITTRLFPSVAATRRAHALGVVASRPPDRSSTGMFL